MNIIQLTPGAGAMYCGNCLRDNALVAALRRGGHTATMVPLYLPLTLDEVDESGSTPIFFGGISVYLQQQSALFRSAPDWLHNLLASKRLLKWAAGKTAKTRAADLGDLTLSMLQGEAGNQARELDALLSWLKTQPKPDVICLSNALLLGMARRLKQELGAALVCMLQGEDTFLDALPEPHRGLCWGTIQQRASEIDALIAPSHYYADLMRNRLGVPADQVEIVHNGITLDGYPALPSDGVSSAPPALGYFTRMCKEKGLDTLVDAWLLLRRRNRVPGVKLRVGGSCGPADRPFVEALQSKIASEGLLKDASFHPNVDRSAKIGFLRSLSVFSVPALYGEAFGLYLLEAMAAGVPVVQPRVAAFPELIDATGGGTLCEPGDPAALATAIEALLLDRPLRQELGENGRRAVFARFSAEAMANGIVTAIERCAARCA